MLDGFKEFLESSTIHGLTYISTSRRLGKLFWICVVILGFLAAGFMIKNSFTDWNDNPIATTEKTLSIRDVTFPTITVCPPRDTFTNLNFDLHKGQNLTIDEQTRDSMRYTMYEIIHGEFVKETMAAFAFYNVEGKNRNYYYGYDELRWIEDVNTDAKRPLILSLSSAGVNDSVRSPYFGEQYADSKFFRDLSFYFDIKIPKEIEKNSSIYLFVKITADIVGSPMEEVLYNWRDVMGGQRQVLLTIPVTRCYNRKCSFSFKRKISDEFVSDWLDKRMTGVEIEWHYNATVTPDAEYIEDNENFIRIVNNLNHLGFNMSSRLWQEIKTTRFQWISSVRLEDRGDYGKSKYTWIPTYHSPNSKNCQVKPEVTSVHLDEIEQRLNISLPFTEISAYNNRVYGPLYDSVRDEVLAEALAMYIYLVDCPDDKLKGWINTYTSLMEGDNMVGLLSTLGDVVTNSQQQADSLIARRILVSWSAMLNLTNKDIETMMIAPSKLKTLESPGNREFVSEDILQGEYSPCKVSTDEDISDLDTIQRLSTHPVHIIDEAGELSPSALIPFCDLGGRMSLTGVQHTQFSMPVCTAFTRKVLFDQLCYEADLNLYKESLSPEEFNVGFSFLVDLNHNRQTSLVTEEAQLGNQSLGKKCLTRRLHIFQIITRSEKLCEV